MLNMSNLELKKMREASGNFHICIDLELPRIDERLVLVALYRLFRLIVGFDLISLPIVIFNAVPINIDIAMSNKNEVIADVRVEVFVDVPHAGVIDRIQVRRFDRARNVVAAKSPDQVVGVQSGLVAVCIQRSGGEYGELFSINDRVRRRWGSRAAARNGLAAASRAAGRQ